MIKFEHNNKNIKKKRIELILSEFLRNQILQILQPGNVYKYSKETLQGVI